MHVDYPMLFRITNPNSPDRKATHCGVMEFSAAEGVCYMPHWARVALGVGVGVGGIRY